MVCIASVSWGLSGAIGTGISDRGEDIVDHVRGLVCGHARRRIIAPDIAGSRPGVRIGSVLHPAMRLAFTNGASL